MAVVTALIVFDQGGPGPAGEAFEGTIAGGAVTVTNDVNTNVASWKISLVDVPPTSALVPGVLGTANSATPSAGFTPDVAGSYRIVLEVYDTIGLTGTTDKDIRNFGIRNARGIIIPPYQKNPDPRPLIGSGDPGAKPDEQNYGGQARGWAGDRTDGQLEFFFLTYDDLPNVSVTTTPFVAAATGESPIYLLDMITAGGPISFTLPTGARIGQRVRVLLDQASGAFDTSTILAPGGQNIDGLSSVNIARGKFADFLYVRPNVWQMLTKARDIYERTIVGGLEDTDLTGFVSIGTTVLNPSQFFNISTATWQAIIETTTAADAAEIRLFNVTTLSVVGGSTLSTTATTPTLVSAAIPLAAGQNIYEAQLRLTTTGAPNRATCKQAQIILDWFQP
jgi:hypothetical protein